MRDLAQPAASSEHAPRTLAPSADLQVELLAVLLLGSLRPGRLRLLRKLILARFDERRKFHSAILRNLDMWRGASNAHRCDRRIDFHSTGFCDSAGHESHRSVRQIEKSRIRSAIWIVHELVQSHPRVARQIERAAISEVDANPAITPGLDHIALIDDITDLRLLPGSTCLNDDRARSFNRD